MSFKIGDFVELDELNSEIYCIVLSSYQALYSNDNSYEEMFTIQVIDCPNKNHKDEVYDAVYYNLSKVTDEKIINKLNKLITFQ